MLDSEIYKAAKINIVVLWENNNEKWEYDQLEESIRETAYRFSFSENGYKMCNAEELIQNRTKTEKDIAEYIKKELSPIDVVINNVHINDMQFIPKSIPATSKSIPYDKTYVYIHNTEVKELNPIGYLIAFAIGAFLSLMYMIAKKNN
ncbi:MAG: hypothetical protein KAQ64_03475 [Candidatus Pacebacteria bacterium]|nr:hypothetical protein [Candidatus Paceibacterota bacterium]